MRVLWLLTFRRAIEPANRTILLQQLAQLLGFLQVGCLSQNFVRNQRTIPGSPDTHHMRRDSTDIHYAFLFIGFPKLLQLLALQWKLFAVCCCVVRQLLWSRGSLRRAHRDVHKVAVAVAVGPEGLGALTQLK